MINNLIKNPKTRHDLQKRSHKNFYLTHNRIKSLLDKLRGEIFNAGYENKTVLDLANTVKKIIGDDVKLDFTKTDDNRSYHISSKKIKNVLDFETTKTIEDAVIDLRKAFEKNLLPNSLDDERYFNIKS